MLKMLENAIRLVDGVDAGLSRVMQIASRLLKIHPRPLEHGKKMLGNASKAGVDARLSRVMPATS